MRSSIWTARRGAHPDRRVEPKAYLDGVVRVPAGLEGGADVERAATSSANAPGQRRRPRAIGAMVSSPAGPREPLSHALAESIALQRRTRAHRLHARHGAPPQATDGQAACDQAKFAVAHLSGEQAPAHPDVERTIGELRTRIRTCLSYLRSVERSAYAGAAERRVSPQWLGGKWLRGDAYLDTVAIPNFYFHVTTAYEILRHNGVPLGKLDFVGSLPIQEA